MNLPNKITISRVVLSIVMILILIIPFDSIGLELPKLFVNESLVVELKYIVVGILFIIAAATDFLDGYIARKKNLITDFGKMFDAIADKILVNSILIILSSFGFIHPIIPVVIIMRDSFVNSIKMAVSDKGEVVAASYLAKIKTACLMTGIVLTLFYNLPFELFNLRISDFLLLIAMVLSIITAYQYYKENKKYITIK